MTSNRDLGELLDEEIEPENLICSHCLRELDGFASINDDYLCHPDDESKLDCYTLVSVAGHQMECGPCAAERYRRDITSARNSHRGSTQRD